MLESQADSEEAKPAAQGRDISAATKDCSEQGQGGCGSQRAGKAEEGQAGR